jgi:hypothetical protein
VHKLRHHRELKRNAAQQEAHFCQRLSYQESKWARFRNGQADP